MRSLMALLLVLFSLVVRPTTVLAHDDPIVTVRVMCNGFNVLDMDAVLGEIADTATLTVDRQVHGTNEIEAWVTEQMDHDLRIEIVDIGTPQRLSDGYTLNWTARFSRQDWRQAGVGTRQVTNTVTIHNGRITDWTASLALPASTAGGDVSATISVDPPVTDNRSASGFPELFGIPVTLWLAGGLVALAASVVVSRRLRP